MQLPRPAPFAALLCLAGLVACSGGDSAAADPAPPAAPAAWSWQLPAGFAPPLVPADNPMSAAKVELGRHLFHDARLSGNGTQSCASCHTAERAFGDSRSVARGSTGQNHPRNAPPLINVAYQQSLDWANAAPRTLEQQMHTPLFPMPAMAAPARSRIP